ncbi:MAG: hypothetical protein HOW73_02700 [Polyangiaceae bacterium]|nr:hypothetical protein [Polyangiaceae bacterium]
MAAKRNDESVTERDFVMTRVFDAPARLLFDAYSRREHLMQWFGPRGYPLTLCEVDFRVGGRFRFAMTGANGEQNTPFGGQYLEIIPNRKIVYDNGFEAPGAERMVVTVIFDELNEKTTLTIHTRFASVAMKNEHLGLGFQGGVSSGLDQLEELVTGRKRRKVVVSTFVTLDGYMVGPEEDISWVAANFDPQMQNDIAEEMASSECFLFGKITYEIFAAYWPNAIPYEADDALKPAQGKEDPRIIRALNECPKLVFSKTLAPPTWKNTKVYRDGLEDRIRGLKSEPGGKISVQGSASVVQALERADLVDEYRLYLHPVLIGAGKQLFTGGVSRQDFTLLHGKIYGNGVVGLSYVRKPR